MLWTAFTIGLFGSLHCVGMCGPLVLALPQSAHSRQQRLWRVLLYNGGRLLSYALLGLLIGTLGMGARLAGLQSALSIGLGVLLLIIVIWQVPVEQRLGAWPVFGRLQLWVRRQFARYWSQASTVQFFRLGMLNGLLPCGLVYLAIVGSLSMDRLSHSFAYMLLFGAGTLPLMVATVYFGQQSGRALRRKLWRYYPVLLTAVSVWLILRGIRFSLPADYTLWQMIADMPMCH